MLDLTRVRAGPTAVRYLADWGANCIKVEMPPGAGDMDMGGPRHGPDFQNLHRNKKSITLNLKEPDGLAVFKKLVEKADVVGSTEMIIRTLDTAPAGSSWAVGTELNLVRRLADRHPDKQIVFLEKTVCYCSTMNRIDLPHLVWSLESLVRGQVVNRITVEETVAANARVALDRMLALP